MNTPGSTPNRYKSKCLLGICVIFSVVGSTKCTSLSEMSVSNFADMALKTHRIEKFAQDRSMALEREIARREGMQIYMSALESGPYPYEVFR